MNPYDHREIIFNGVPLPVEMMGIDHLERLVVLPESVANWLWRLPICRGVEKTENSSVVRTSASFARDALLEHKALVLAEIRMRLPDYQPEQTYSNWMKGLTKIIELSQQSSPCHWISPLQPADPPLPDTKEILEDLQKLRARIREEESGS